MVTTKRKKRLIRTGLLLLVLVAGAAYYGLVVSDPPWFDVAGEAAEAPEDTESSPTTVDDSRWQETVAATAEAGIADLDITVRAVMPEDLDDGVTRRRISGEGALDLDSSAASAVYAMDKVPNSAGYFGHVSGDLDTVYAGPELIATFPQMAKVLEDADWMSYDLETLSNPHVIGVGIGQLRELAIADPRLGIALLNGSGALADQEIGDTETFTTEVDLDAAIEATTDTELIEVLTQLQNRVHASSIEAEVTPDAEGRIETLTYTVIYPAGRGPDDVKVSVTTELTGFDGSAIEVPDESEVTSYAEFLKL